MATRIPTGSRNAAADAVVDRADLGAGAALLRIYSGAQPASANDAASGTLLVEFTMADPSFGAAATGVATAQGTPLEDVGLADGTAGWFRIVDSDGNTVVDGAVTATGGGGEIELDNTSIATDQTVRITALTVTMPATT